MDLTPEELIVPDSIEPIIGWKALTVEKVGDHWILLSPQQHMPWPQRQRAEAACDRKDEYSWQPTRGQQHEAPIAQTAHYYGNNIHFSEVIAKPRVELPDGYTWSWEPTPHKVVSSGCGCGIYMVDTAEQCVPYIAPRSVICRISMWGTVIKAAQGARGQYAYPQSIEYVSGLTDEELHDLVEQYGLPLRERTPATNELSAIWISAQKAKVASVTIKAALNKMAPPKKTSKRRNLLSKLGLLMLGSLLAAAIVVSRDWIVTVLLTIVAALISTSFLAKDK